MFFLNKYKSNTSFFTFPKTFGCFRKWGGTPKSSIVIGFSIIFTIHFGVPLFSETSISFESQLLIFQHSHAAAQGRNTRISSCQIVAPPRISWISCWFILGNFPTILGKPKKRQLYITESHLNDLYSDFMISFHQCSCRMYINIHVFLLNLWGICWGIFTIRPQEFEPCIFGVDQWRIFRNLLGSMSGPKPGKNPKQLMKSGLPSRKLTYPTWGTGKSSSKCHFGGIC